MPTKAELDDLLANCDVAWTTVNGVNGYVIAPDGFTGTLAASYANDAELAADKLVFLPAAGLRPGSSVYYVGERGSYWSSTASGSDAFLVYFYDNLNDPNSYDFRYYGNSVRLVTDVE